MELRWVRVQSASMEKRGDAYKEEYEKHTTTKVNMQIMDK